MFSLLHLKISLKCTDLVFSHEIIHSSMDEEFLKPKQWLQMSEALTSSSALEALCNHLHIDIGP